MVAKLVNERNLCNLRPLVASIPGQVSVDCGAFASIELLAVVADGHDEADG